MVGFELDAECCDAQPPAASAVANTSTSARVACFLILGSSALPRHSQMATAGSGAASIARQGRQFIQKTGRIFDTALGYGLGLFSEAVPKAQQLVGRGGFRGALA